MDHRSIGRDRYQGTRPTSDGRIEFPRSCDVPRNLCGSSNPTLDEIVHHRFAQPVFGNVFSIEVSDAKGQRSEKTATDQKRRIRPPHRGSSCLTGAEPVDTTRTAGGYEELVPHPRGPRQATQTNNFRRILFPKTVFNMRLIPAALSSV